MSSVSVTLPCRFILTDDPMRARMLSAHHLEYADQVYESGDVILFSGSYKNVPIAVASTGFGVGTVLSCFREVSGLGAQEAVYVGGCVTTTSRHGLRTVVLASGGSQSLLERACAAAKRYVIPAVTRTVLPPDCKHPEEGGIVDGVTGAFYEQARMSGIEALSILTVSENAITGEKMEEHEIQSRFYGAARLAFEMFA